MACFRLHSWVWRSSQSLLCAVIFFSWSTVPPVGHDADCTLASLIQGRIHNYHIANTHIICVYPTAIKWTIKMCSSENVNCKMYVFVICWKCCIFFLLNNTVQGQSLLKKIEHVPKPWLIFFLDVAVKEILQWATTLYCVHVPLLQWIHSNLFRLNPITPSCCQNYALQLM